MQLLRIRFSQTQDFVNMTNKKPDSAVVVVLVVRAEGSEVIQHAMYVLDKLYGSLDASYDITTG